MMDCHMSKWQSLMAADGGGREADGDRQVAFEEMDELGSILWIGRVLKEDRRGWNLRVECNRRRDGISACDLRRSDTDNEGMILKLVTLVSGLYNAIYNSQFTMYGAKKTRRELDDWSENGA